MGLLRHEAEAVIQELAAAQHGVVARFQLLERDVSPDGIDRRIRSGRFRIMYRGVFRVGPIAGARASEMAAVLAVRAGAALSHWNAGRLLQMPAQPCADGSTHVTVRTMVRSTIAAIRIHHCARLGDDELTRVDGVPVTTAARTLLDLAAVAPVADLERALAFTLRTCLAQIADIQVLLDRHPNARGARTLLSMLQSESTPSFTRSQAESRLLSLIRKARLAQPATNARILGLEVDMYWPREGLVVEVDGYAFHGSPQAFENDRRRDAVLAAAGIRVMRVTWRQLTRDRDATIARLAQALKP